MENQRKHSDILSLISQIKIDTLVYKQIYKYCRDNYINLTVRLDTITNFTLVRT